MKTLQRDSIIAQATDALRRQIKSGALQKRIPGVRVLAAELGVSRDTVRAALLRLEAEGWLCTAGHGRAREVSSKLPHGTNHRRTLSVALVSFEPIAKLNATKQNIYASTRTLIEEEGDSLQLLAFDTSPSDRALKQKTSFLHADAWVLFRAPSGVIQWFIAQGLPAFALGGFTKGLPIAANSIFMASGVEQAVNHLRGLGHRRIVLLTPSFLRKPFPSTAITHFIEVMADSGIEVNDFHLPDWDQTPEGLTALLTTLHAVTPPTAYIIVESNHALGVLSFFHARGLSVPRDCSVVVIHFDSFSEWWQPPLAHFEWNNTRYTQQIRRWLRSVREGRPNIEQQHEPTRFIPTASVGRPPRT